MKKSLLLIALLSALNVQAEDKTMIAEFKNGTRYEYEEVPHNVYAEFRLSESQGKYFNSKISKVYKYKKLP